MSTQEKKQSDSYYAILDAAVEEFALNGYAGVRMEHVAKRAGFNKSLVYRFFKNRESLFEAALEHQFLKREKLLTDRPGDVNTILSWWSDQARKDPLFIRMVLREALEFDGNEPVSSESRAKYYQAQVSLLEGLQKKGLMPAGMDPQMLFIALLSITILPQTLPQICQLVTGQSVNEKAFSEEWTTFLNQFNQFLAKQHE